MALLSSEKATREFPYLAWLVSPHNRFVADSMLEAAVMEPT